MRRFTDGFTGPITDSWRRRRADYRQGDYGRDDYRQGGRGQDDYRQGGRGPGGRGPRGRRGKVKGSWWRHWTLKKAIGVAFGAIGGLVVLVVLVGLYEYSQTSIPAQTAADVTFQNSTVYYSDGTTALGTFGTVHRQILTYNQIPQVVDDAVMAAEDRSFMTEGAISPTGILRAAWDDIHGGGGNLAGGSTITQEFVRNYYADIGTQQTLSRKIKEIFVAEKVSKEKSKQWILTNYLNTIPFGEESFGVAAASETYFHEPVSKLDVAQAAALAALIQAPGYYPTPAGHAALVFHWRHDVLDGLVKMGDLSAQQAATMKFPAMSDAPEQSYGNDPWDPYVMQEVYNELTEVDHMSQQEIDTGGLKIVLTVSREDEEKLYQAVDQNVSLIKQEGFSLPSYALIGAELQNPSNGDILAIYGGPGVNVSAAECAGTCQLNTTLQTEQVGSSFKPYTLSAAVKEGMNVQTSLLNGNSPLWVPPFGLGSTLSSTTPKPASEGYHEFQNDSDESLGALTVQNALAQSSNTAFTDLAHRVGLQPIEQMAESEGGVAASQFAGEEGVGITLGQDSLSVNNQASMVSTIDDDGVYHAAHMVASITEPGGMVTHPAVATHVSLTPAQDSEVQYAMEDTVVDGTATAAEMDPARPIIGKTGTTTSSKSAFFIGAIPQYTLAVGIYTKSQDTNNTSETLTALGGGGFGGSWPASIWHTFAQSMWTGLPVENFLTPQFSGQAWIQVPQAPKPKPKKQLQIPGFPGLQIGTGNGSGQPTQPGQPTFPVPTQPTEPGLPTNVQVSPSTPATATGPGSGAASASTQTASAAQAGLGFGGLFLVLPGSLLWARTSRRRSRRRRESR